MSQIISSFLLLLSIGIAFSRESLDVQQNSNKKFPTFNLWPDKDSCFLVKFETQISVLATKTIGQIVVNNLVTLPVLEYPFTNCFVPSPFLNNSSSNVYTRLILSGNRRIVKFQATFSIGIEKKSSPEVVLNILYDRVTDKYRVDGGSTHGFFENTTGSTQVLTPVNSSLAWVQRDNLITCREYLLHSATVANSSLQVTFSQLKFQLFKINVSSNLTVDALQKTQFSNSTIDICPQFPVPEPEESPELCYLIKLKFQRVTAALLQPNDPKRRKTENITSQFDSYTFSNCSKLWPSVFEITQKPFSLSATNFLLPLTFQDGSKQINISVTFNHTSGNYSIGEATAAGFSPNKTFELQPLNSSDTTVALNQSGTCNSYNLQSKQEEPSKVQLTITFQDFMVEVFRNYTTEFQASADLSIVQFSNNSIPICRKNKSNIGIGLQPEMGVIYFALCILVFRFGF